MAPSTEIDTWQTDRNNTAPVNQKELNWRDGNRFFLANLERMRSVKKLKPTKYPVK
jgi:hypothetical protein